MLMPHILPATTGTMLKSTASDDTERTGCLPRAKIQLQSRLDTTAALTNEEMTRPACYKTQVVWDVGKQTAPEAAPAADQGGLTAALDGGH